MATSNIVLRGTSYYFRRVVPVELRSRIGRRELVCSLGKCNVRTARLRADLLFSASEQLFDLARHDLMLSDDQLSQLVQGFYKQVLDKERAYRSLGNSMSQEQREQRAAYWKSMSENIRNDLGANALHNGSWTAIEAARLQGLDWPSLEKQERYQVSEAVHRAGIDLAQALAARYNGDFNFKPKDDLLTRALSVPAEPEERQAPATAPAQQPGAPGPSLKTLSELYPEFIQSQIRRGDWRPQMGNQADATYRLFCAICGDRPLANYMRADAMAFRKTAERMPYNYGKAAIYRSLSPDAIITRLEALPPETRSPLLTQKTIKRHFAALSKLWSEALAAGDVTSNIFTDFKFKNVKRASDERDMWEEHELRSLFGSPVWTGSASEWQRAKPGNVIVKDEKFWVPLVTLFSGMRLEEICQLRTDDIKQEDGIWFIDINDRPPRQLKNKNAVRKVPVHSQLLKLGFLDYVTSFGKRSYSLFPQLKPGGADNKLGHSFSKWFTRYRQQIGLYRKNLDFHSLRHTATTHMHQADVKTMVIDHLTGHSTMGETARYTKGSTLRQLAVAIETINPSIILGHLYIGQD